MNGRIYEAVVAFFELRPRRALYHSALTITLPEGRYVIESAPIPDRNGRERGVVLEGPVASRVLSRWRIFRYEVRCWRSGSIPDLTEAVASPQRLTDDRETARRVLALAPALPAPVWGRDDLRTGEMWNSNSVVAWLLVRGGIDPDSARLPAGGRAPCWHAGLTVARRCGSAA